MTVTPALAEKLGRVFYSPGFWLVRQAMSELKKPVMTAEKGPACRAK